MVNFVAHCVVSLGQATDQCHAFVFVCVCVHVHVLFKTYCTCHLSEAIKLQQLTVTSTSMDSDVFVSQVRKQAFDELSFHTHIM